MTEAGVVSLEAEELGAGEESVSVEEVAAVGEREEWAGMKQNYHQGGYHNNKLHGLKMFFSSFHWPTLHSITQVVPMFKVDQSKDWRLKCKQSRTSQASCSVPFSKKHIIYYTSPYLLLFFLLLPLEGSVVAGALVLTIVSWSWVGGVVHVGLHLGGTPFLPVSQVFYDGFQALHIPLKVGHSLPQVGHLHFEGSCLLLLPP